MFTHLLHPLSGSLCCDYSSRNREEVRRKVAERKKKQAAAAAGMANINEDGDDEEWTEESEFGRRSGRGGSSKKKKSRSETRSSGRRGTSRRNKGGWRRKNSSLSPVSSSGSSGRSPSQDTEDKGTENREQLGQPTLRVPRGLMWRGLYSPKPVPCAPLSSIRTKTLHGSGSAVFLRGRWYRAPRVLTPVSTTTRALTFSHLFPEHQHRTARRATNTAPRHSRCTRNSQTGRG